MQEKALDASDSRFLSGGDLNGWSVPSLRGMKRWSVKDITDYLATGRNDFASVGGEMTSVVEHSMQHMSDGDLGAIAHYLKSLPPDEDALPQRSDPRAATAKTVQTLMREPHLTEGQMLYLNNCAACHATDGGGAKGIFPRLNGAEIVLAKRPAALISIVLKGAQTPGTKKAPSVLLMPGFGDRLTDAQVAALTSFLRSGWGNNAAAVSAGDVAKVRARSADVADK